MWSVSRTNVFEKHYRKLRPSVQSRCDEVIDVLANSVNPRMLGSQLSDGTYRYRFGDYRLIYDADIQLVLIDLLDVGHRSDIYS